MYIRYNVGSGKWQCWWNFILWYEYSADPSLQLLTGNQANSVVESSDFNSGSFTGFSTDIGGYLGSNPVTAIGYLFNGAWVPAYSGDPVMAGYAYMGGNNCPGWGIAVGDQAPPIDKFTVRAGWFRPAHGSTLWSSGTFS
jgi:hypothetical protein